MRLRRAVVAVLVVVIVIVVAACGDDGTDEPDGAQIPNPASEYCIDQGGELEIVTGEDGSQVGMCTLPDGRVVEEWDLYRSEGGG
jgi:uncharacterized protein